MALLNGAFGNTSMGPEPFLGPNHNSEKRASSIGSIRPFLEHLRGALLKKVWQLRRVLIFMLMVPFLLPSCSHHYFHGVCRYCLCSYFAVVAVSHCHLAFMLYIYRCPFSSFCCAFQIWNTYSSRKMTLFEAVIEVNLASSQHRQRYSWPELGAAQISPKGNFFIKLIWKLWSLSIAKNGAF